MLNVSTDRFVLHFKNVNNPFGAMSKEVISSWCATDRELLTYF